jgi:cellulose synthase/poly-beta-1,6-N-acetylglucosamine synthase-like glycosyltransferase
MDILDVIFWLFYIVLIYFSVCLVLIFVENIDKKQKKAKFSKWPSVSVIIPAHNEEENISQTIESVLNLDYPKNKLEVIVVNDGSTDRTGDVIKKFKKKGVIIINQENKGKGAALNTGLKRCKGEFVACLDADSVVEPSTLKEMIVHFTDKNIAAVTPLMKVKNPESMLQKIQWLEYIFYFFVKKLLGAINSINITPGPFSIYRKKALLKVGGFDEKSIVEDQEIAYRLQKYHYKIVQSEDGSVFTNAPKSFKELYKQRSRWFRGTMITLYKYKYMMFNKNYGDFGIYQLPSTTFGLISIPFVLLFFVVYTLLSMIDSLRQWYLVNFSINFNALTIENLKANIVNYFFSIDYGKIFVMIAFFSISFLFMKKAHDITKDRIKLGSLIPMFLFFFVYYIILSFIWLGSLIELLIGRRRKW